jgi:hypothetical protein
MCKNQYLAVGMYQLTEAGGGGGWKGRASEVDVTSVDLVFLHVSNSDST